MCEEDSPRLPHLPPSAPDSDDVVKSHVRETALEITLRESSHITEGVAGLLCGAEKGVFSKRNTLI